MSLIPNTNAKYVGIEIECIIPHDQGVVQNILNNWGLAPFVKIGCDGSIECGDMDEVSMACPDCDGTGVTDDEYDEYDEQVTCSECDGNGDIYREPGYELKVLVKQSEMRLVLNRLQMALKSLNASVNESCGLHVHLDMRNRDFAQCAKKLLNVQGIMFRSVTMDRKNNEYCMPVLPAERKNIANISKYHAIHTEDSMRKYRTIEVRLHEGTVDCNEILNWCKFLITTIDTDVAMKKLRTTNAFPIRVKKYLDTRISKNATGETL